MVRVAVLFLLIFWQGAALAAPVGILALYTDACYNVEGGDVLGYRMGVLRLSDGPYIFFQEASGDWGAPKTFKAPDEDLKRGKLSFTVSGDGKPYWFRGTITEKSIAGHFDGLRGDGKPLTVRLKRIAVSQKGAPDCR